MRVRIAVQATVKADHSNVRELISKNWTSRGLALTRLDELNLPEALVLFDVSVIGWQTPMEDTNEFAD